MDPTALETLKWLATTLVAVASVVIAWGQFYNARQRWRLDLYDKRFATYRAVTSFISLMCLKGTATDEERITFTREALMNEFLFDREIKEYINTLYQKSLDKGSLDRTIENTLGDSQDAYRGMLANKSLGIAEWFSAQFEEARNKFGKYLTMRHR